MQSGTSDAGDPTLQRAVGVAESGLYRGLRTTTIVVTSLVALAAAGLIGWLLYQSAHIEEAVESLRDASFMRRGLVILTAHTYFVHLIAVGLCAVAAAAALVFAMRRHKRWAFPATAVGAAAVIVPLWLMRGHVFDMEARFARSTRWAEQSPYVTAATTLTIGATIVLAVLAVLALATYVTARRAR